MAAISYFVIGPSAIACLVALLRGPDKKKYVPTDDYEQAKVDIVIPAYNEQSNIALCLASIVKQTFKPANVFLVDDGSTDKTSEYAKQFSEEINLQHFKITRKSKSEGKTPALSAVARESEADILFVLDADTTLDSPDYIKRLVQEMYKGKNIASACGLIMPQTERDRQRFLEQKELKTFADEHPDIKNSRFSKHRFQKMITNLYREEVYLFLENFVYLGQMIFCGTLINPVGCAVAYRKSYLVDLFDHFERFLGSDLTTSEDVFIGFTFDNLGYRNIQVSDVLAVTEEPPLFKLPKQIFKWSSSFFQCCYYFDDLLMTPLKYPSYLARRVKEKRKIRNSNDAAAMNQPYYLPLGAEETRQYGRPIGWFIFAALIEKITFPLVMLLMIILQYWEALIITMLAEALLFSLTVAIMYKKDRIKNFLISFLIAPIRYVFLLFELVVIGNFIKDLWFTKNRKWRK